jgi:pimeloyl-ACP methyl ester carboxylesterase
MKTRWGTFVLTAGLVAAGSALLAGTFAQTPGPTAAAASVAGEWDGMIGHTHLVVKLQQTTDGALSGTLTVPDQGNVTLPIDSVTLAAGSLKIEIEAIGATYVGAKSAAGDSFEGTWAQGAANLPLTLRRPGAAVAAFTLKSRTIGSLALTPCRTVDGNSEGLCGTYPVWENRTLKSGRKLALKVMVLPALNGSVAADAFVPMAGGPGQSALEAYPVTGYTNAIRRDRDVVLVDQRGTGGSAPMECSLRDMTNAQQVMGEEISKERLAACVKQLEPTTDLTQYTTSIFADDLDEVRAALGYDKIDVLGGSNGTRAAMVYLRQHPEHVRTIALEGVAPPEYRIPLNFPHAIQTSIDRIIARCEADEACHKAYPELKMEFVTVLDRLEKSPVQVRVSVGGSGKQSVTLTKGMFVSDLRPLLYVPEAVRLFPLMVHKAFGGDFGLYASVTMQVRSAVDKMVNRDMSLSVVCSEDLPGMTEAMIRQETDGTYLGDYDVKRYQNYCSVWPHGTAPTDFHAAIHSDVPALLISGALDPATPPEVSAQAARDLTRSQVVLLTEGTHGTGSACVDGIVAQFVKTAGKVDASCVEGMKLGKFVVQ